MKSILKKITIGTIVVWLSYIFIMLLMLFILGCKTKQKTIEREKESIISNLEQKGIKITNNDIKIDSFAKKGSSVFKVNDNQTLELTQADSSKTITLEDEKGNKLKIKGANATIKNEKTITSQQDSLVVDLSKKDKTKTKNESQLKKEDSKDSVKRKADSDVKTTSIWLWIVIAGVVIIIVLFYIKKKTSFLN
ncbi:hypothetical protein CJ739_88 [Mariniflexile rhizosphaerae]|uniref:hypothetical protein n=1 Tax=unclassified Mariniflexile TaxID=2643887 RepID=UPI000E333EB9|nr:hypothetical protein [Mariniflexile sp. TRM1-10]AXP79188.1 hypothetical protein CJ739_88 [Mariniflexile sp. TRM1-10]